MKRLILLSFLFLTSLVITAQTQQGRVKTRGRLAPDGKVIPGNSIPNATITLGNGATAISGNNGGFTFAVSNNLYYIKNVQKNGYQLCDRDLLGKNRKYSSNILEIAMQTPDEALEDRLESEEKIRATLTSQLNRQKAELKRLRDELKISQQDYNAKLQALYATQGNNEKLISEMAERYSTIDFDQIDEFQRRVAYFIQNGELARADSLLKTKDAASMSAEIDQLGTALKKEAEDIAQRQMAYSQALEYRNRKIEELADLCMSHYEICLLQHKNDSAAYWLELRASKDTTNVDWQLELGVFVCFYLADLNKSMQCYQLALRATLEQHDSEHPDLAKIYNNIATVYDSQGNYTMALEYHNKALDIIRKTVGEAHPTVARRYNNIGAIYSKRGDYAKAEEYLEKALWARMAMFGEWHPEVATSYHNLGTVYYNQGKFNRALEYLNRALTIRTKIFGEKHPDLALSCNNIGLIYDKLGEQAKALEYYNKALDIQRTVFGEEHPSVALSYNNIGSVYNSQGRYPQAMELYTKALDINIKVFGEQHPSLITNYSNLGTVYEKLGEYDKSLDYHTKALNLAQRFLGAQHPDLSVIYSNIGILYETQKEYAKALEYYAKTLALLRKIHYENHPQFIDTYINIFSTYEGAKQNNVNLPGFDDYLSDIVFTATTVGDNTPATQLGWNGEYIIYELADWNLTSPSTAFMKMQEIRTQPKTLVLMKDGNVVQHHFEDAIGVRLSLKYVGKAEKQKIVKQYLDWKKKQ